MCGIAGAFARDGSRVDRSAVERLSDGLRRRGPDGSGFWTDDDGRVAFGHRRLAVIGLGPGGAQPLHDAEGRYVITFNGEIYNYRELRAELEREGCRFLGQSDTEVVVQVVARWGERGLRRLRGMFAFALWDRETREGWLVRDPFGIKPLYWSVAGSTVWFASQARPLSAVPGLDATRDPAALAGFYQWGHVPEPFTWWNGIRSFPAGHVLRLKEGEPLGTPEPFFRIADCFLDAPAALAEGELESLLRDSVAHHLVADIPVGLFLSSGIDSTLLAVLASEVVPRLSTVTLAFEDFRGTEADEAPLAEATARTLGSDHVTWRMTREEFDGLVDDFIAVMDQPTIDGLNSYCVSYATARSGIKVAMSGLGADELFAGYPSFTTIPKWLRAGRWLPPGSRRIAPFAARALMGIGAPAKAAQLLGIDDLASAYLLRRSLHAAGELDALLDREWLQAGLAKLATEEALRRDVAALEAEGRGLRSQISLLETSWYMRNQLLRDTDWASMAHGLEVRVPFVDVPLFRRVAAASASERAPTKADLARSSARMPDAIVNRRKTGFTTPVRSWLDGTGAGGTGLRDWSKRVHALFGKQTPEWA